MRKGAKKTLKSPVAAGAHRQLQRESRGLHWWSGGQMEQCPIGLLRDGFSNAVQKSFHFLRRGAPRAHEARAASNEHVIAPPARMQVGVDSFGEVCKHGVRLGWMEDADLSKTFQT